MRIGLFAGVHSRTEHPIYKRFSCRGYPGEPARTLMYWCTTGVNLRALQAGEASGRNPAHSISERKLLLLNWLHKASREFRDTMLGAISSRTRVRSRPWPPAPPPKGVAPRALKAATKRPSLPSIRTSKSGSCSRQYPGGKRTSMIGSQLLAVLVVKPFPSCMHPRRYTKPEPPCRGLRLRYSTYSVFEEVCGLYSLVPYTGLITPQLAGMVASWGSDGSSSLLPAERKS
jgi:hypothetical protein